MAIDVRLANNADDAGIRGLLRREPVPGRIAISYEREPSFSLGCEATGEDPIVVVACDRESGEMVGVACRSDREVFVNGRPMRLGYLGQLRVDRRYRGRWLVSRGYSLLRRLHERNPSPAYLATLVEDNDEAAGILVEKPRRLFPAFRAVGRYLTLALPTSRSEPSAGVSSALPAELPEIGRFLQEHGARRQFFPVWTAERLLHLAAKLDLRIDDIRVVRRNGGIAGVMALWDQSSFKQAVVRGYSGWMRAAALTDRFTARLQRRPRLPKAGEKIRSGYAALACVADDASDVFDDLLSATLRAAHERNLDYLLLGLDERDALLAGALSRPHVPYRSQLYLAEWPTEASLYEQLDHRPSYVEVATL